MRVIERIHAFLRPDEGALGADFVEEVRRGALRGLHRASILSIIAALTFTVVYQIILPSRFSLLLPSLLGMTLLGAIGVVASYSSFGMAHPRSPSVILAMSIGTLIVVNQVQTGSHSYGHFGGLSLILLVMASLGTLQPYAVLVTAGYFILIYLLAGLFLDRGVGWPPAATFVLGGSSLTVSGITAVWLTSFSHRVRRTEFRLRDELSRAFRELQDAQAQLLASEKALSQSQLVAALCHELNNPFGVIVSNLSTQEKIGRRLEDALASFPHTTAEIPRLLRLNQDTNQGCRVASQRISDLLERLQDFTHLDEAKTKPIDINQELLRSLEMVKSETGLSPQIEKNLNAVPTILSQPQKISLAFSSLLRNAFQALEAEGGTVKLSTTHLNQHVEIMIEDNGKGIDPQELKSIFDPKFVPQAGKVRTSWGLATSRQIFFQHKGHMELKSTPGQGTQVKVILPIA
jgi:signal transduction histidine kinase